MSMEQGWAEERGPTPAEGSLGSVLAVEGSEARIGLAFPLPGGADRPTVGKFVAIKGHGTSLVGMISQVYQRVEETHASRAMARVDLLGEIERSVDGTARFRRGVREYAAIGDPVEMIGRAELNLIYAASGARTITVGHLSQDPSIPAYVDTDHMLAKHFAVVGSTGVGKSSAVASILGKMVDVRPELRVLLLDVHNEYRAAFGGRASVIGAENLRLSFWLFNFEEMQNVIYAGKPAAPEEVEILAELIPIAKAKYIYSVRPSMPITISASFSGMFAVNVVWTAVLTPEALHQWKSATYAAILKGYTGKKQAYDQAVALVQAQVETETLDRTFALRTDQYRAIELTELKRGCLELLTEGTATGRTSISVADDGTPTIVHHEADATGLTDWRSPLANGTVADYFETCLEWQQATYESHPYYWAGAERWAETAQAMSADPVFERFLQAGSASVVVPVRPGYERPFLFFLKTGLLWSGRYLPLFTSPEMLAVYADVELGMQLDPPVQIGETVARQGADEPGHASGGADAAAVPAHRTRGRT